MRQHNQLEPEELINSFINFPPENFEAARMADGTPYFITDYNLLTTLDAPVQKKIMALPFYDRWKKFVTPRTCFIGTVVSEYALLPDRDSNAWIENFKNECAARYDFLIIKDLPQNSPLLPDADSAKSAACMTVAKNLGFIPVEGQALAHVPIDFKSIDEYLGRLSKITRKGMRRKLKSREDLEIHDIQTGDAVFNDVRTIDEYYQLYLNVYAQSDIHFDKLTRAFFESILRDPTNHGIVITYRHQGELIGYNICFVVGDKFIDKYVGFKYPAARDHDLYFVSWFVNLEYALARGLKFYVAGWTDPEVKKSLGAKFTMTRHMVYIRNPIIRALLKPLTFLFESDAKAIEVKA